MSRHRFLPSYRYYEAEGESSVTLENTAGKPLRDYRIYGNTVDGVSCGDKTKNLLDIRNGASKSERGITYTNNGDGTITFGGTFNSTTYTYYRFIDLMTEDFVPGEAYTIGCGCEINDSEKTFGIMVQIKNNDTSAYRYVNSNGTKTFTLAENETVTMFEFRTTIKTDVFPTVKPTLMTPFVYKGECEPVYEPYGYKIPIVRKGTNIEPIAFNIYLDEPLYDGGSIGFLSDDLPEIFTEKNSTNIIEINTEVPPSKLWVQYYK